MGVTKTTCSQWLNDYWSPGYGTCSFQHQLNSVGSIQPCCHHVAGNQSGTRAITVQPGPHSLVGRESVHTGKVSCPRIQRHAAAAETSRSKIAGRSHRATTPCMHMEYYNYSDIGTLRVVTARKLVLSGSFTSHSMSVRQHPHLRDLASHGRYTVSIVEGRETNLHRPLP